MEKIRGVVHVWPGETGWKLVFKAGDAELSADLSRTGPITDLADSLRELGFIVDEMGLYRLRYEVRP